MKREYALECLDITKSFGGVPALRGVNFGVAAGRTLGLVGENGAGKSTLMNVLGGNLKPDGGSLRRDGAPYAPRSPGDAQKAGIAFIHQELNLFPNLSVAENMFLTRLPRRAIKAIDRGALHERTKRLLAQVGLNVSPETRLERLSTGERQLVEIAKALALDARVIIFDEPTTSLSARECDLLFGLMERLRADGITLIYISHNLGDVLRLCDDIVVLRDGAVVASGARAEFTVDGIIAHMVGRSLTQLYPKRRYTPSDDVLLSVKSLSEPNVVRDVSFGLRRGEVLGLSGVMGAGRSELARILFGLDRHQEGEIRLEGRDLSHPRPRQSIEAGLAFLTEDRRQEGLCMDASVSENFALVTLRQQAASPLRLVRSEDWKAALGQIRQAVRLNAQARDDQKVRTLSGGNQQKIVLGKWLLAKPRVLILDEPTRGVDVGARFELYQLIHDLADSGSGVLLISSELEELLGMCDRILVMKRGKIAAEFPRAAFDREKIIAAALEIEEARP